MPAEIVPSAGPTPGPTLPPGVIGECTTIANSYEPGVRGDHPAEDDQVDCVLVAQPTDNAGDEQMIEDFKNDQQWFDDLNP